MHMHSFQLGSSLAYATLKFNVLPGFYLLLLFIRFLFILLYFEHLLFHSDSTDAHHHICVRAQAYQRLSVLIFGAKRDLVGD